MDAASLFQEMQALLLSSSIQMVGCSVLLILLFGIISWKLSTNSKSSKLPLPPCIPGLPILGNLLQLKEKKPHKMFSKWAESYGPVYSIKLGANTLVVLNRTDVAKEAMITRHSSITTRKLSTVMTILTLDKRMILLSDYNDFYKTVKRHILASILGSNAQKKQRYLRDILMDNLCEKFHADATARPLEPANYRTNFDLEVFTFAVRQAVGIDADSLYVEEFGKTISKEDMYKILVIDDMEAVVEVDWRDLFPYLRWVPFNKVKSKIQRLVWQRTAVIKALIKQHSQHLTDNKETCYLDCLLSNAKELTNEEVTNLMWEPILETSDAPSVTTEWAMYMLAKNPTSQDRLFSEIKRVCGDKKYSEDDLSQVPYLTAIFQETLRRYSPVPLISPRYVHEDTEIGGFRISAGMQILINLDGCNMDKGKWENPEEWNPDRFMDEKLNPTELYSTMAFGAGKRACAGALQTMLISTTAIGRFVQEFEWKLVPGEDEEHNTAVLTNRKLNPLQVIPIPRVT